MTTCHRYMKLRNEVSQKKVETDFFWIKMVLLIFTAIIEAPKYRFFSFLKVSLDLKWVGQAESEWSVEMSNISISVGVT